MLDSDAPTVPRPRRRWWRTSAIALIVCAVAALVGLHLPITRHLVLTRVVDRLAQAGVELTASRLSYNLLTLQVALDEASLRASGQESAFLTLEQARVNLPWSVVTGNWHVQAVELVAPRVTLVRDADGRWNLPAGSDSQRAPFEGPVTIERLLVDGLALHYEDVPTRTVVDASGVSVDMSATIAGPLEGTVAMADEATITGGDRSTTVETLAGRLSFDGKAVEIRSLDVTAPEGEFHAEGAVDALDRNPQIDLRYRARIDVGRAASWSTIDPAPTGFVLAEGSVTGDRAEPVVSATFGSEDLAWSAVGPVALDGRTVLSAGTVALDAIRFGAAGGVLTANGRLALADEGASTVTAEWNDLDVTQLLAAFPDLTLRPGSRSTGTLSWTWRGTAATTGSGSVTSTQRATAVRRGVVPLAGPLRFRSEDGRWNVSGSPTVAGSIATRLNVSGELIGDPQGSPVAGDVDIEVTDLASALETLAAAGLIVDLGAATPTSGTVSAALTLEGTLAEPRATGTVDGDDLVVADTGPMSLRTQLDVSRPTVRLDDLRLVLGTNRVAGSIALGLDANTMTGTLRADLPDLSQVAALVPAGWRPDGSATVEATLGGALDNPTADVMLRTGTVLVAGQTIDSLTATGRVADRRAAIDRLVLTQREGQLTASGYYGLDDGRYSLTASGTDLPITPIVRSTIGPQPTTGGLDEEGADGVVPIEAVYDVEVSGDGTVEDPRASGQLRFATVNWQRYQFGAVVANVSMADGQAQVEASIPSISGSVDGTLTLESGRFAATVVIDDAALATLARASGPAGPLPELDLPDMAETSDAGLPRVAGTVDVRATADGLLSDVAAMDVLVELGLADVSVSGVPVRLDRTVRLRHTNGTLIAEDVQGSLGTTRVEARGRLGREAGVDDRLTLEVTGSLADFAPLVELAPGLDALTMNGDVTVNVEASGALERPAVAAYVTVANGQVATATLPPVTGVTMAASYSAGIVNVSTVAGRWQGADLLAVGHAPLTLLGDALPDAYRASLPPALGPARFDVLVANLNPDALSPFLSPETVSQIAGRVDLAGHVEATALDLGAVTGEFRLDRAAVELARVPLRQTEPTRLRLTDRRLDVIHWNWTGTGNEFSVRGHVLLGEDATTLDLGVAGSLDLRMFSAFAPGLATAGRADLDLTARGTATEPLIEGDVTLADAAAIVGEPRLAITGLSGVAHLTPNRIELNGLTASANGGEITIIGGIDYSDFAIADGAVTITGRGLAIEAVDGLRTELDADLTFAMAPDAPALGGRVTVVRGDFREPLRLTERLFSTLEVQTSGGLPRQDGGFADQLQLDIAIVSAQDITVANNYGQLEVGANLRVTGTPTGPILGGRLALREGGEVFLGGQTYTLRRGTVDFTSATRIEPNFNISLDTRVSNYDITLDLTGTPNALEVAVRGPGLSQEDAVSLLLTGQLADESTTTYSTVARGQLLMLLSGELLSTAGRAVGLDSVQISRGLGGAASSFDLLATDSDSDPEARLTLAKNLSRQVELIMSQSLRNSSDITWIAVYRPIRRVETRVSTDGSSRETYEFRHELQFGQNGRVDEGPSRPPDRRIAAVRIEGTPGVPNADILTRLRLLTGDRFDYFTWQRDRDRVAALYHDRGYFEATIDASREPAGADSITLVYDIDPGPHTLLDVVGYSLPGGVIEDIERAWTESVYDGFLEDDVELLVRRDLVSKRLLRGTVDAAVTTSADGGTKTLSINVVPGLPSATRRIAFSGNQAVSSNDLRSVVEAGRRDILVWLEPEAVETTLETFYRSRGHLLADVSVAPTQFDDGTAILPVHVDEGPAFRLGMVGVSGAAFRTADTVRTVSGLTTGSAYRPAEIEPARRRVEVDYLGSGYNDVTVSTIVGIDEERAVADVVFAIAEGPQQVLRDVEVRGADVTSTGTINRALALDTGNPVDMSGIYAAQKRLYDTSVFERVDIAVEPIEGAEAVTPGTQAVRALVDLQELPQFRFRYGLRISDLPTPAEEGHDIRPGLVADLLNRNLFGRAIAAGVAGQLERDRRLVRGLVSLPSFIRLPVTTNFFVTRARESLGGEDAKPFISDTLDFTLEQRIRPTRTTIVTWGYTLSKDHRFESTPAPSDASPLDERYDVARLTATFAFDRRDDVSDTSRGWFHSTGLEYGPEALGSHLRYVRLLSQQFYFHELADRVVLASAFRVGAGHGFGEKLLPNERFYIGGGTSLRGFAEKSVGGRDVNGFINGGEGLVQLNQEIRFPIFRWFHGVGFFDAGNVFPRARALTFRTLEAGTGAGLRIASPFAVFRIDYGIPLTSRERERPRWYFGIGHTF